MCPILRPALRDPALDPALLLASEGAVEGSHSEMECVFTVMEESVERMLIYSHLKPDVDQKTTPLYRFTSHRPPKSLNYDHIWKSYPHKAFINDVSPAALEMHESCASVK